ncbi:TM2 domain-containing protein [Oceaniovalibus guishaninsula JLT2003]|uniref:TM2 domain-containing protein n=2 Tax=Oceaniovalibus TaxID=1207070 RepID=K2HFC3_9RHOB|nr:TM2 domain-containing protein [Oceaniovalibus guishaninsula JLT2003]
MAFQNDRKSTGVAYLLWFFLGGFGIHRFYLGKTTSAVMMLLLSLFSWLTLAFVIGFFTLAIWGIWMLVDLFLIPGMARAHNERLAASLSL